MPETPAPTTMASNCSARSVIREGWSGTSPGRHLPWWLASSVLQLGGLDQVAHLRRGADRTVGEVRPGVGRDLGPVVAVVHHEPERLLDAVRRRVRHPVETFE